MNLFRIADAARDMKRSQLVPALSASPTVNKPNRGATTTNLTAPRDFANVSNQPSMKIRKLNGGGVEVVIRRNARYAGILDKGDTRGIEKLADEWIEQMRRQSQGTLSTRQLRKMRHPYGRNARGLMRGSRGKLGSIGNVRGVRGSVGNLNVVNRQSGAFAGAWERKVEVDESGVTVRLINNVPYASALALGTRRMVAHGGFSSVPTRGIAKLNSEWQKAVRAAYNRKAVENDLAASLGI